MRASETREKNPYNRSRRDPKSRDQNMSWGNRDGDELGYQKTYGEYGSNARGWVDKPHAKNWARREEYHETYADYSGIGPKSYQRSDESLLEHISEALTWSPEVDASEITIAVKNGDVILSGTVPEREMIYLVDELMEEIHGIKNIDNHIKLERNI